MSKKSQHNNILLAVIGFTAVVVLEIGRAHV